MTARLFHVSDLHFGREDRSALAWFAATVRKERPDAVIVTGDLTMRARSQEFAAAEAWLAALGVPVTIEPGNHDLPYLNPLARLIHPYRRVRRVARAIERPLDVPGVWLVPLETTARAQWRLNWSRGHVADRRLDRALRLLQQRRPGDVAIVACHHPLIDAGTESEGRTRGGAEALHALAEAGADAVLSGHVHDPFDIIWDGNDRPVRLIGAGTLSERVRESAPSFNEVRVADGRIAVEVRAMH